MEEFEFEQLPSNLEHIITSKTLKWIFVGGKGGVGKTTTSCSLGVTMAKRNPSKKILIISTDPAHNTSDAFDIKFSNEPTKIPGLENLSVMEIDVKESMKKIFEKSEEEQQNQNPNEFNIFSQLSGMMNLMKSVPGIDEAISFSQIINQAQKMNFDIVIFDTAPTGHTLRFLSLPTFLKEMMEKILQLQQTFGAMFGQFAQMMGMNMNLNEVMPKLQTLMNTSKQINEEFTNPDLTTFIPVLIPEFLPLYETERLLQELMNLNMDANSLVINQILPENECCEYCKNKRNIQMKYLSQIDTLYGDFHLVKINMQTVEVRGMKALKEFGSLFEEN